MDLTFLDLEDDEPDEPAAPTQNPNPRTYDGLTVDEIVALLAEVHKKYRRHRGE